MSEIEQWAAEYVSKKRLKSQERRAWEDAARAQSYVQVAPQPQDLVGLYRADMLKQPLEVGEDETLSLTERMERQHKAEVYRTQPDAPRRYAEFVDAYEEAYYANRQEIDPTWFMQFTPQELRAFGAEPLARHIETAQAIAAYEAEQQQAIQAEFDRRLEAHDNQRSWWQTALAAGAGLASGAVAGPTGGVEAFQQVQGSFEAPEIDEDSLYRQVELEFRGRGDEIYEDEIQAFMAFEKSYLDLQRQGVKGALPADVDVPTRPDMETDFRPGGTQRLEYDASIASALEEMGVDDISDLSDEQYDELLAKREMQLRNSLRANPQLTDVLYPGSGVGFVQGGMNVVGTVMDKAIDIGSWVLLESPAARLNPAQSKAREWLEEKSTERQQDTIRELEREMGTPPQEVLTRWLNGDASRAWESVEQENPEVYDEYLRMAGFDPTLAFSFFQADLQDQISPEEQLEYLGELRSQEEERIEHLRENDFRVSDEVLHWLGVYGRNVPGRLSTMFTLLLTDEDFHSENVTNNWIDFWKELNDKSELYDHTPSAALGIDGSVAGLMLDLGSGIAFDPTTWIFGPRLGARAAKAGAGAVARSQAKSSLVRQMGDDIVRHAMSPSKSSGALYHVASWLDSTSLGELLNITGINKQTLKNTPWTKVKNAQEVSTGFLHNLIPDGELADDLTKLSDDIIENGFQEPITVHISRSDDMIWIDDGVKRVRAADQSGISHVPVVLKYVDDVPAGRAVAPGFSDDTVRTMQRIKEMEPDVTGANEGTRGLAIERTQELYDAGAYRGKAFNAGSETLPNGQTVSWRFVPGEEAGGQIFAVADDGTVVISVSAVPKGQTAGGSGFGRIANDDWKGQNLLGRALDKAHDMGEDLINYMHFDSLSTQGHRALVKWIDEKMATQAGRSGVPLDSILKTGESLGKPRKTVRPFRRNPDATLRPDSVLPKRLVTGDINFDAVQEVLERAILERGAVPNGAAYSAVARHTTTRIKKLLNANAPGKWVERYMTPQYMGRHFGLTGPTHMDDLLDLTARVWGDDSVKFDAWTERLMRHHMETVSKSGEAARRLSELQPRLQRLREMQDVLNGGTYDDPLKFLDDETLNMARQDRARFQRVVAEEEQALREAMVKIDKETGVVGDTQRLEALLIEMAEDYNRTYIATNKFWADAVDDTGLVPWDDLRKGKPKSKADAAADPARALSDDMIEVADEMGIPAEDLMQRLSHSQNAKLTAELPLSPMEMIMASELGGAAWTRATHTSVVNQLREAALAFHRLWVVDKVFTVSTAATVSFDELLRIFHLGGNKTAFRWMGDKAIAGEARLQALLRGKGIAKRKGAEHLSAAKQERLRNLQDYSNKFRQAERQSLEQHGLGWQDIAPGEAGFEDAARAWSGGLVQDSGFRAFLNGRDAFRDWFFGPDGERLRRSVVVENQGGTFRTVMVDSADEFYDGWSNLMEVILQPARKAGRYDEVLEAWRATARQVEDAGGAARNLPDVAINHMGPVRGIKKELPHRMGIQAMTEGFFDKLFMDPVNYRRGFLADLTRTHEKARLRGLFESQGKRIISDAELEGFLQIRGLGGSTRGGLREAIYEMALREGVIPEGYIDNLAERAVVREIENTLYSFDVSSRLGAQSRVAFPFGKPWADMAGFWGREVVRKPAMRGWINQTNALWLRSANERGLLSFPVVPNRPAAMVSRLAHTDFTIDQGLLGDLGTEDRPLFGQTFGDPQGFLHSGGILPGATQSDFSPLLFLPTGGENPFSTMIPGLGIVPIAFLDWYVANKYDPVKEPEEYQALLDEIGDFIPSVHFQQGGFISRLLGGGTTSRVVGSAVDIAGMTRNEPFFPLTSEMGDISREIDRTREISALLADPQELEMILSAGSVEEADALIEALAVEADKRASLSHLAETGFRYMAPVQQQFSPELQEIENVWLDAAQFEELNILEGRDPEAMTDEDRRQLAADIRSKFFDLEPWKRDLMVVQQPSLAVNMVGSWEWTPKALNDAIDGTKYSYRTGGSPSDLARHEYLVRKGYVRPVQPIERARRILGVIQAAKHSAAKELYESQVGHINDLLWTTVPDETKADLEWVVDTQFAKDWGLNTVEEVWRHWRTIEEDLEIWMAEQEGIEPVRGPSTRKDDLTEFDLLRQRVKIAEDDKPWGSTFPGLEEEDVSNRFDEWVVGWFDGRIDPKAAEIAEVLGIDLRLGTTGEELFAEVQQVLVEDVPGFDAARPSYDRYIGSRSVRAGENKLYQMAQNQEIAEELQENIHQFLFTDQLMGERRKEDALHGITQADRQKMVDEFYYLMNQAGEDWGWIWEEQYEDRYGPLEWEPPEPRSPFDENGDVAGDVTLPHVRHVVDGDTILIQEYKGSPVLNSVRLLGLRTEEITGPNSDVALEQERELREALVQAVENGDNIYLVRDERFGFTDKYGRMLAWLWIGDTPFYKPEHLLSTQDPSGGEN